MVAQEALQLQRDLVGAGTFPLGGNQRVVSDVPVDIVGGLASEFRHCVTTFLSVDAQRNFSESPKFRQLSQKLFRLPLLQFASARSGVSDHFAIGR